MNEDLLIQDDWVPAACTLPTVEQPLRRAEFDDLFDRDVLSVRRLNSHEIKFTLRAEPEVAGRAAALAAKETLCCSFFTFTLTAAGGTVEMTVSTEPEHGAVIDALLVRAQEPIGPRP